MKICVIANNYPSEGNPKHVYLENLVKEFIELGNECVVIAPQSRKIREYCKKYFTNTNKEYYVYSPMYRNYSGRKIGFIHLGILTQNSFQKAVEGVYLNEKMDVDVFYAQFLPAGLSASYMAKKFSKQFYIDNGESSLQVFIDTLDSEKVKETFENVSAIFSVSTKNKDEVLNNDLCPKGIDNKVYIVPNGINPNLFHSVEKQAARKKIGIDEDIFVVISVGQFNERKGTKRLSEALNMCEDVYSIFIGAGKDAPNHKNCLFEGRVNNADLKYYLNASDIFVLATLNEGCSNAIIEAMACGLPIISSNKSFNFDILDNDCSLLIDPENIDEIHKGIELLKNNRELRNSMSLAALKKAEGLVIAKRASRINDLIIETLNK